MVHRGAYVAVYHFTLHAYRSWRPDHPRGYTLKGDGYLPPDSIQADQYDARASQDGVIFDDDTQKRILLITHEICERDGWRLDAAGFDPTHTHLLICWRRFLKWEYVDQRLKNLLALKLNRHYNTPGKRWFVRRHGAPRVLQGYAHQQAIGRH